MVTNEEKYRAYTFNIAGFGLLTPLGKVIFDFVNILKETGIGGTIFYMLFSLLLFFTGLTFIEMGRNILYRSERKNALK